MCGIAGIMFKHAGDGLGTGHALIDMLDGCQHRGPDSTGFALYGDSSLGQLKLRFFVGEGEAADESVERVKAELAAQGAETTAVDGDAHRVDAVLAATHAELVRIGEGEITHEGHRSQSAV